METHPIDSLFSQLTPLRRSLAPAGEKERLKPLFSLTLREGEPFISIIPNEGPHQCRNNAEVRLYAEIERLSAADSMFGLPADAKEGVSVSLWQNPYLTLLLTEGCEISDAQGHLLSFTDIDSRLILRLTSSPDTAQVEMALCIDDNDELKPADALLDEHHALCGDRVYAIRSIGANYSSALRMLTTIETDLLPPFLTLFLTYFDNVDPILDGHTPRRSKHTEHAVPTLYLEKVASDKALYMRTGASIESMRQQLPEGLLPRAAAYVDETGRVVIRDVEGCDIAGRTDRLEELLLASAPNRNARKEVFREGNFFIVPEETAGPFLLRNLPQVLDDFRLVGSEKLKEYKVVAATPRLNLNLSSGIDFLEGDADVTVGTDTFTLSDLLKQYSSHRYVQLSDGNRGIIDENYIQRLQRLFRRRDKDGKIRVTLFDLPEVEELMEKRITGSFAAKSRKVLEGFNDLRAARVPKLEVKAKLRPYQEQGVKWFRYLYDNDLGGCLADDMGLGKTLQTIALLTTVYPKAENPSLIIMPRSLLFNWEKELDKFAPQLTHSTYYGQERDLEKALESQIVLTTYALVRNDIESLRRQRFECVVLDESQSIKNVGAQTTAAVLMLDAAHRFALSGTPMENNLTELYSLFRFLNPPMFGTMEDFNASYTYPIQKFGDKDTSESLRRKIFPFILRRLKKDVLKDLPDRIDQTIYVEMSEKQKKLYEERRAAFRQQISDHIAREGVSKSQFIMFQALSELRRIASVPEAVAGVAMPSPKIDELMESLLASVDNGHKSVVFFNFIAGLETMMERLDKYGIQYETMTGSTSASGRKKAVERFQSDPECKVMLLTLKVGGVGLNLTAADTVYIFEPWWNKAAEEQAINRLHRIGQKKTVSAFSLITVGTIEEKMLQLQAKKSELFDDLISADTASTKTLSEQDIDFILS